MIRRLIILLLIVGCVFGDIIKYKESLFLKGKKENVKYLGINKGYIYFKNENDKINSIPCQTVYEILDSNGIWIDYDCTEGFQLYNGYKWINVKSGTKISINNSNNIFRLEEIDFKKHTINDSIRIKDIKSLTIHNSRMIKFIWGGFSFGYLTAMIMNVNKIPPENDLPIFIQGIISVVTGWVIIIESIASGIIIGIPSGIIAHKIFDKIEFTISDEEWQLVNTNPYNNLEGELIQIP